MARQKRITVSDMLALCGAAEPVQVIFYAYGIYYADTLADDMHDVDDIRNQCRKDLKTARVTGFFRERDRVVITAEVAA